MNKKQVKAALGAIFLLGFASMVLAARPTVKISAAPTTIAAGGSSTLTWISTNATSASINNNIGSVPVNGSMAVTPTKTTTYTITVRNSSSSATARVTITVKAAPPTVTFAANPTSIIKGQSSTLSWTTTNATSASINQNIGRVALNGSKVVKPTSTKTYTITVKGSGGTVTASATVTVTTAPPPTVTFTANPDTITQGGVATLSWTTTNATSASINQNIGTVALNGSRSVTPTATTIYTITVKGNGGTATASATVTVTTATPPTVTLTANPGSIRSGQQAILSWTSTDATSAEIDNGIGAVPVNGSYSISPTQETTYTITVSGPGGTATAQTTIYITNGKKCYAYVPNSSADTVTVIDTASNTIIKTIPTNKGPIGVALTHDGAHVFVSTIYDTYKLIHSIDTANNTIIYSQDTRDANIGAELLVLDDTHTRKYLYAASLREAWDSWNYTWASAIFVYNMAQNGNIGQIKCLLIRGGEQGGMVLHPDGTRLYLSKPNEDEIICLDTAKLHRPKPPYTTYEYVTDEQIATIPVNRPYSLVISPDGNRLYATGEDGIVVVDTNSNTVLNTIPHSASCCSLAIHPDGSVLYVATISMLEAIDTRTNAIIKTLAVDGYSSNMSVHPDGSHLYMTSYGSRGMNVVDTTNLKLIATIPLAGYYEAYGNFVGYVSESISGKVTQDDVGMADVKVTVANADGSEAASAVTDASGNYMTAVAKGTYTVTPTKIGYSFLPEQQQIVVEQAVSGCDFTSTMCPAPTVTISAQPQTVSSGQSTTITWSSTNATSAVLGDGVNSASCPVNGSEPRTITKTTTFTITVTGAGGTATANVMVTFDSSPVPTVTFSAEPIAIQTDGSSTLSWTSTNATSASIDNGIGSVPVSGSQVVTPAATTTYTITVSGTGGTVTASATVTVGYDTSAILTGTVTDLATSQPIADVTVSAVDASGVPKTAATDASGKYIITNLRVGSVAVSFAKGGYDPYQQTINIRTNTTFDLATQLHLTLVGATMHGLVKDGQTAQPIVGATAIATFAGGSLTSTSGSDGAYALVGIPLNTPVKITATAAGYRDVTINPTFTQNTTLIYDFVLYNTSVLATVNGKITNAKTLLPEEGVKVTHKDSNVSKTTADDGTFVFDGVSFGEQAFYLEKTDFVEGTYTCTIDRTPFAIDLIKPSSDGGQITIGQTVNGVVRDSISQLPIAGAKVRIPALNLEVISDANGNYSLTDLPINTYPMIILALNHQALDLQASVALGEANKADFALIPAARGLIGGVITDSATGKPVAEASIEIGGLLAAISEGDGTYKMVGVPPGTYKITISHGEYHEAVVDNVEVFDMTPTTVNLQLNKRPQTGTLAGRILDVNTGNPISSATVSVSGTSITATTDANGNYNLANVPAGLNTILVSTSGYPQASRIRTVIADQSASLPSTTSSDIPIDANSGTVDEAVTSLIKANEGGAIISKDGRFTLHIFPDTLSADANITLTEVTDGTSVAVGGDLPLDPALGITGIKAASVMTKVQIASVNGTDPAPTIDGLAAVAMRYSQKDADDFQLDESSAFPYFWNGTAFSILNPRPYETAVDRTNNIAYAVMDFSSTATGAAVSFAQSVSSSSGSAQAAAPTTASWKEIGLILGKAVINFMSYRPSVRIIDKNELDCVTNANADQKPNPNALPLLFLHGFDPFDTITALGTNPNKEERYKLMLQDIVEATNGVYRPVFVSYNTRARIAAIGGKLAEKVHGEYLNKKGMIKGLPADPADPDSGSFPYLDTFGYSMGGLVSRSFLSKSLLNMVHNMVMIATPNHGTMSLLKYLSTSPNFWVSFIGLKILNPGGTDMLDYDDSSSNGFLENPFLFSLNSPINSRAVMPRGDMTLFAGNDPGGYGILGPFLQALLASPNDSLVPVRSVFCRPTGAPDDSKLSLLATNEPRGRKYEIPPKNFTHENIGKSGKQIKEFSNEIALGFSDWTVERGYNESPDDNAFVPPGAGANGYCKGKVKVEYNVWVPDAERQARDIDRVVLVLYHKDGNGVWHISEPNGGENGADSNGNVNVAKVKKVEGNSNTNSIGAHILSANVIFDANPENKPEKMVVDVARLFFRLKPGETTVTLDPTKVKFRIPSINE